MSQIIIWPMAGRTAAPSSNPVVHGSIDDTGMRVELASTTHASSWDAYVLQAPSASTYHQWSWRKVIELTYGHHAYYLIAIRGDIVEGVLPLIAMKSWLFGHFLVSLPFVNYGGVLASTAEARTTLLNRAEELSRSLGVRHLELRQGHPLEFGWQHASAKVAMVVLLPETPGEYLKGLGSRLRNKIRHAQKHGLVCRWGGAEMLPSFYRVFCVNMRNLGTPVYPYRWFENVLRIDSAASRILTVFDGEEPVATTVVTNFRHTVELPWIASTPEARKHYSAVLLYWTALEWAIQNGYSEVDLGRCTPGGGTYQFKRQWNCEERPLHWYYWLARGREIPELRPDNPKYRVAIWAWQHLPLSIANWLGPRIVRSIP